MSNLEAGLYPFEKITSPLPMKRTNPGLLRRENRAETDKGGEIWLITLSDLLMLLVIFFVILFGMELQKRLPIRSIPGESQDRPIAEKAGAISAEPSLPLLSASLEKDLIAALNLQENPQGLIVQRASNWVTLTFPEQIVFDPGHAQLKPSAQATLDKVASFIRERPHLAVEVQGHTDDRPINSTRYPSNLELSVDRATQVAKALIRIGADPSQFSVKGFGEYRFLHPNDSDENRLKNRRVEIQLALPPR